MSIVGLYEAEPQVAPLNEDAQNATRAMADKLISNGCDKCNLFVVRSLKFQKPLSPEMPPFFCLIAFRLLQMDNAKLGELMDEKSEDMPFHVRSSGRLVYGSQALEIGVQLIERIWSYCRLWAKPVSGNGAALQELGRLA